MRLTRKTIAERVDFHYRSGKSLLGTLANMAVELNMTEVQRNRWRDEIIDTYRQLDTRG